MDDFKLDDLVKMKPEMVGANLTYKRMLGFTYRAAVVRRSAADMVWWSERNPGLPAPRQWLDLELVVPNLPPDVPRRVRSVASSRLEKATGIVADYLRKAAKRSLKVTAEGAAEGPRLEGVSDQKQSDPKRAAGSRKPDTWNVPDVSVYYMAQAMDDGARKYGRFNWRHGDGVNLSVYVNAMQRHLAAFKSGEDTASDSGVHHLAHLMAGAAILLDAAAHGKLVDDRGPPSRAVGDFLTANTKKD